MAAISSSLSQKSPAPITPSTCLALRVPTIAPVTAGCRSVQAIVTASPEGLQCAVDRPEQDLLAERFVQKGHRPVSSLFGATE